MNINGNIFNSEIRDQLAWMNPPAKWEYTANGELSVEAPPQADFYQDPAGKHYASSAPFLHITVGDSFELTTRLSVEMLHKYDSGCLMLMIDERNWAKLCFEYNGKFATIVSVVTKDGISDDCNSMRVEIAKPYLRISAHHNCISFHYSLDGEEWELVRYFGMKLPASFLAGIVAQSPQGTGCLMQFDYLELSYAN